MDLDKTQRLYVAVSLGNDQAVEADDQQFHYLRNVMRQQQGDMLRLLNGRDGEWLYRIELLSKKQATLMPVRQLRPQPEPGPGLHLYFTPLRKERLDWLVEKAVELGVTHFHPVLTQHTAVRTLNAERLQRQIIEAAEQCERLTLPELENIIPLERLVAAPPAWPVLACVERQDAPFIASAAPASDIGLLIGPEGGFSIEEKKGLTKAFVPVNLGENILRSETATLFALSALQAARQLLGAR